MDVPFFAWDFASLTSGGFIFAYAPMEGNSVTEPALRYRIFITDQNLKIKEKYFEYGEKETDAVSIRHYLSGNEGKIVYGSFEEDGFCVFDGQDGTPTDRFRFAFANGVSKEDKSQIAKLFDGYHTFLNRVPYMAGDYLLLSLTTGSTGNYFLYDSAKEELSANALTSDGKVFVGIVGSSENSFIGWLQSKTIYDHMVRNMGFQRADPDDEAAIYADEAFLVFYRMN